jgi:hypothetical protein
LPLLKDSSLSDAATPRQGEAEAAPKLAISEFVQ